MGVQQIVEMFTPILGEAIQFHLRDFFAKRVLGQRPPASIVVSSILPGS